jgi:alpha-tubulin suppressor-like RCC1 family protein
MKSLAVVTVSVALACTLTTAEVAAQVITVTPESSTISVGQSQQFTATGVSTATAVDMGAFHSCAVLQDGRVHCWGANGSGGLGDGTTTNSLTPVAAAGITGAAEVSAGGFHTCARFPDGTLQCWGRNNTGQLGDPALRIEQSPRPVRVAGITATAVTAGGFHTCALPGDGTVWCWGQNDLGQLGNGTSDPIPNSPSTFNPTPGQVRDIAGAVAISAGGWHTCALLADGTVRCWGDNTWGQMGNGATLVSPSPLAPITPTPTPVPVTGIDSAVAIEAGIFHTCVILQDGTVRCWGRGEAGRLGNGTTANSSTPTPVGGITPAVLAPGAEHTCAVFGDGSVRCWGDNNWNQLGNGARPGTIATVPAPPVIGITNAIAASAGAEHSCAVLLDGSVGCWGRNADGRLGDGTTTDAFIPVLVTGIGVTWTSSDTSVATIDANGLATALGLGSTTITVTSGGSSESTILRVVPRPTLAVVPEGTGSGTVRSRDERIVCGAACSADYEFGGSMTLTAVADPGSTFEGWRGGGCVGTADCTVTLTANTTVFAGFRPTLFTLTVTINNVGSGSGTVSSSPGGINDCAAGCSADYESGAPVTLAASPATGSIFTGWNGGCAGTDPCTVTMTEARSVTATFEPFVPSQEPFARFGARAQIVLGSGADDDRFAVEALVTLGAGSNGIDPLTEPVTLALGIGEWTIPPGSFRRISLGGFVFKGSVGATSLAVVILPSRGGIIGFAAVGAGAELTGAQNPVDVRLIIGDDSGTTAAVARVFSLSLPDAY